MPQTKENRKVERVSTERPVEVHHIKAVDPQDVKGKMLDLSVSGTGILTDSPIEENEQLKVLFSLPNQEQALSLSGTAIHAYKIRNQYLIGVQFNNISDFYASKIQEYITYHHRLQAV